MASSPAGGAALIKPVQADTEATVVKLENAGAGRAGLCSEGKLCYGESAEAEAGIGADMRAPLTRGGEGGG